MIQKLLFNTAILISCYVNIVFSSEDLIERRSLPSRDVSTAIKDTMNELSPDIILDLCQRASLQEVKHLSELNKYYSKFIGYQILPMKAAQRLNCRIDIVQNPSDLQLKFIKEILKNNFKLETFSVMKRDNNKMLSQANYGIRDDGDIINIRDYKTPPCALPYDLRYDPISHKEKGFNFRHLVDRMHVTERIDDLGVLQVHIKTDSEERFLQNPDKVVRCSPIMVSLDGNNIVGRLYGPFGEYSEGTAPFLCTNQKDIKQLSTCDPHSQSSYCHQGDATCVSGDGKVIGGSINCQPAVWIDGNCPFLLNDFIKAPKSQQQELIITDVCQISPQGKSWFRHGYYTTANRAKKRISWIVTFDFDKQENSVIVSNKRKRVEDPQRKLPYYAYGRI